MLIHGYTIAELAKFIIIVCAILAIVYLALQYFEITIAPIIKKVAVILLVAVVCILGIEILVAM